MKLNPETINPRKYWFLINEADEKEEVEAHWMMTHLVGVFIVLQFYRIVNNRPVQFREVSGVVEWGLVDE